MHAVILAGGLGTRLRPFSITIPKPLLPLGDKPILDVILTQLSQRKFTRVTVLLGYMSSLFQAFLGDGSRWGLQLEYVIEDVPLGTAGALRLIQDPSENFLVINGDTLTTLDFGKMLTHHTDSKMLGSVFCARIEEFVDYGVVEFDKDQSLTAYKEKPTNTYYVSTGVYALRKDILCFDHGAGRLDMPDLFKRAMAEGHSIHCYTQNDAYWRDIGRFDHFDAASKDFQEDRSRFIRDS